MNPIGRYDYSISSPPFTLSPTYDLVQRLKNAVFNLFAKIVCFIKLVGNSANSVLMKPISKTPPAESSPVSPPPPIFNRIPPSDHLIEEIAPPAKLALAERIKPYEQMPNDEILFIEKAISLFRQSLSDKPSRTGEKSPLQIFDEEWETMLNINSIATSVIRAFIFSETELSLDLFSQKQTVRRRFIIPLSAPLNDYYFMSEGSFEEILNHRKDLIKLRIFFKYLPESEKEIIFDKRDFSDIGKLQLSDIGKDVLHGIANISYKIIQANNSFLNTLKEVYQKKTTPSLT